MGTKFYTVKPAVSWRSVQLCLTYNVFTAAYFPGSYNFSWVAIVVGKAIADHSLRLLGAVLLWLRLVRFLLTHTRNSGNTESSQLYISNLTFTLRVLRTERYWYRCTLSHSECRSLTACTLKRHVWAHTRWRIIMNDAYVTSRAHWPVVWYLMNSLSTWLITAGRLQASQLLSIYSIQSIFNERHLLHREYTKEKLSGGYIGELRQLRETEKFMRTPTEHVRFCLSIVAPQSVVYRSIVCMWTTSSATHQQNPVNWCLKLLGSVLVRQLLEQLIKAEESDSKQILPIVAVSA